MIIGSYPCCDGTLTLSMPDQTPAYFSEGCPHCGATVWHRLSRLQSMSWTQTDFLDEHDVDADSRTIKPKPGTEAARFEEMNRTLGKAVADGSLSLNDALGLSEIARGGG